MNAVPQTAIAAQPAPSPSVAKFLKRPPRLFIGNEWVEAKSQGRIPVFDPATGQEIAQGPIAHGPVLAQAGQGVYCRFKA